MKTAQLPLFTPIPLDLPDQEFLSLRGSRAKKSLKYHDLPSRLFVHPNLHECPSYVSYHNEPSERSEPFFPSSLGKKGDIYRPYSTAFSV